MSAESDITRKRGDTKPIVFRLWADRDAGEVFVTTDCEFAFTVDPEKAPEDATNNLFSLTGVDIGEGRVQFVLTDVQADIIPGTYYWDIQVTDGSGYISTPLDGKFKVVQDITK